MPSNKIGVLLINLGTPESPTEEAVRNYLRDFLSDPYVITLPKLLRDFLVKKIILPKRPAISAKAYQQIWTPTGSPFMVNSIALKNKLMDVFDSHFSAMSGSTSDHAHYFVALGMRYGNPSIESAIQELKNNYCKKIIILPLFPQYSHATTTSALQEAESIFQKNNDAVDIKIIRDFHNKDFYIDALANTIKPTIMKNDFEFLLLSYHGLPKQQRDSTQYRNACHETSELIAKKLGLNTKQYQTAFQSRLGFTKWITPYTDHAIKIIRQKNIQKLSIACPSFVVDCVETLEEINIRLRAQWATLNGKSFEFIPCVNADAQWVMALANWLAHE